MMTRPPVLVGVFLLRAVVGCTWRACKSSKRSDHDTGVS